VSEHLSLSLLFYFYEPIPSGASYIFLPFWSEVVAVVKVESLSLSHSGRKKKTQELKVSSKGRKNDIFFPLVPPPSHQMVAA
jgi:hypothetical protein